MDIYVGNLSFNASEDDVSQAFAAHGEVSSVKIVTDRETGRPRGFAFISMPSSDEANEAINNLNGTDLLGRELKVREATPRPERPQGGYQGGGGGGGGGYRGGGGGGGGNFRKGGGGGGGHRGGRDRRQRDGFGD